MTCALSPTGLIPWFSKTEVNTYATLLHHPFLFKGKPTHAQEVARRISGAVAGEICAKSSQDLISRQLAISGAVAGEIYAKSRHTKYPSQTLIPRITLFAICLSFSSPPLHPCCFIRPLFSNLPSLLLAFSCACVLDCLSLLRKIIPNCVTFPIKIISLVLLLLLLMMLSLVKSMLLC